MNGYHTKDRVKEHFEIRKKSRTSVIFHLFINSRAAPPRNVIWSLSFPYSDCLQSLYYHLCKVNRNVNNMLSDVGSVWVEFDTATQIRAAHHHCTAEMQTLQTLQTHSVKHDNKTETQYTMQCPWLDGQKQRGKKHSLIIPYRARE